jgi:peptide/nickel transport system substrate-binding protein
VLRHLIKASAAIAALTLAVTAPVTTADAQSIKWARSGDALTLDPHAQNEGPTSNLSHQIYEVLIHRNKESALIPGLATSWKVTSDPAVWEFKLRPGVKFHDGSPLTPEDVVFSFERAMSANSDYKGYLSAVEKVSAQGADTVLMKTKGPNPLLPNNLTNIFIMSKAWADKNNAAAVQDYKNKGENFAVRNANGTGAYKLVSREQDVKTVLAANADWWGKGTFAHGVSEIVYLTIKADATRVAALLSGEVDLVHDMPVQDIERLEKTPGFRVNSGAENRTIFLGMDVKSPELKSSDIKGKNPFADVRVRQAMSMAIDRDAIRKAVMRGQSVPAGALAPPFVNGYTKELDTVAPGGVDAAKKLLTDAGYPNGFSIKLDCPNDRYVSDEGICQAVTSMLARVGIKITLNAQSKAKHFPLIQKVPVETEFYLLGWGVPTYDSHYIFSFLYQTRSPTAGSWNASGWSNAEADTLINTLPSEIDTPKRNASIASIWAIIAKDNPYVALHHQSLAYAMKDNWDIKVSPENRIDMREYKPVK